MEHGARASLQSRVETCNSALSTENPERCELGGGGMGAQGGGRLVSCAS